MSRFLLFQRAFFKTHRVSRFRRVFAAFVKFCLPRRKIVQKQRKGGANWRSLLQVLELRLQKKPLGTEGGIFFAWISMTQWDTAMGWVVTLYMKEWEGQRERLVMRTYDVIRYWWGLAFWSRDSRPTCRLIADCVPDESTKLHMWALNHMLFNRQRSKIKITSAKLKLFPKISSWFDDSFSSFSFCLDFLFPL